MDLGIRNKGGVIFVILVGLRKKLKRTLVITALILVTHATLVINANIESLTSWGVRFQHRIKKQKENVIRTSVIYCRTK